MVTNVENLAAIVVAIGEKHSETIFFGLFSFDEKRDVAIPAVMVFPVLSRME